MRSGYTAPLRLMLLPVLAVAVSCAPAGTLVSPSSDVERSYELGAVETASTGTAMIEAGRVFTVPTYSPTRPFAPPDINSGVGRGTRFDTVSVDTYWEVRRDVDGGYFLVPPSSYIGTNPLLHISDNGKIQDGWVREDGTQRPQDDEAWPSGQAFERTEPIPKEGSFEFEILYAGRQDQTLRLTYREYLDGLQRPDYTQRLTYNLVESDTITFRSIEMEVRKASNSQIRFRVLEDSGLPWLPKR